MGQQQSKDELVYQQVKLNYGNIEGIKSLHAAGAGLEWIDEKRRTPLIVACSNADLYNFAKTLIELGANINAYSPGPHAGTPLHHAAEMGLDQTVQLLISHGANASVMNDDGHTPLVLARSKGYSNIVRTIEAHICLFSGWLKELHWHSFIRRFAPQFLSENVRWVVVLPCTCRNPSTPLKLYVAIYTKIQDPQPCRVVPLEKANIEEPNFTQPKPAVVISDTTTGTGLKLAALSENDEQLLRSFCNACKGIPPDPTLDPDPVHIQAPDPEQNDQQHSSVIPSAPPIIVADIIDDGPIHYPSIDNTVLDLSVSFGLESSNGKRKVKEEEDNGFSSTCVICLDAPVEGACIPCGHMVSCMSCLNGIKAKNWGCPVCRANINKVLRIYSV